jgi:hypothetical protein
MFVWVCMSVCLSVCLCSWVGGCRIVSTHDAHTTRYGWGVNNVRGVCIAASRCVVFQVRGPDYDIVPEAVFKTKTSKTFAQANLQPICINQVGGGKIIGVLVYATAYNPPLGCWRVSYEEAMMVCKSTHLADSEDLVLTGELAGCFDTALGDMSSSSAALGTMAIGDSAPDPHALAMLDHVMGAPEQPGGKGMKRRVGEVALDLLNTTGGQDNDDDDERPAKAARPSAAASSGCLPAKQAPEPAVAAAAGAPVKKKGGYENVHDAIAAARNMLDAGVDILAYKESDVKSLQACLKTFAKKLSSVKKGQSVNIDSLDVLEQVTRACASLDDLKPLLRCYHAKRGKTDTAEVDAMLAKVLHSGSVPMQALKKFFDDAVASAVTMISNNFLIPQEGPWGEVLTSTAELVALSAELNGGSRMSLSLLLSHGVDRSHLRC